MKTLNIKADRVDEAFKLAYEELKKQYTRETPAEWRLTIRSVSVNLWFRTAWIYVIDCHPVG